MVECQSCGGTYEPIGKDGVRYFHACPPLSAVELRAALAARTLQLSDASTTRLQAARDADAKRKLGDDTPLAVDIVLASLTIERLNKRDENILHGATKNTPAIVKAEGAGVLEVVAADAAADVVLAEPPIVDVVEQPAADAGAAASIDHV